MGDVMRKSVLLHYYHTCERTYLSIHPQPFPSHCRRNEPKLLFIVRLVARAPALSLSILAHPLLAGRLLRVVAQPLIADRRSK